jgi:hypothetical protein
MPGQAPLPEITTVSTAWNIFIEIALRGDDRAFRPRRNRDFRPTLARPGSAEKVMEFCRRVELGLPLFHPEDGLDVDDPAGAGAFD